MIISSFDASCVSDQREMIWMAEQRVESDRRRIATFSMVGRSTNFKFPLSVYSIFRKSNFNVFVKLQKNATFDTFTFIMSRSTYTNIPVK